MIFDGASIQRSPNGFQWGEHLAQAQWFSVV
jgi:hypothetical protein